MKSLIVSALFCFIFTWANCQTVIEMMHPSDANIVLLQVDNKDEADVIIYRTELKDEFQAWDCMWKMKSWGFSNFSVYITKDLNDSLLVDDDTGNKLLIHGKVFFTENPSERGYKDPNFRLEGVLRKVKVTENPNGYVDPEDDDEE
ncbi:MAG: hypothetical protein A2W91_10715 [Bacteroidetes bacterium GWF2_38_335]|nr:MAG: hypothetical protein A2W91_10715 [Bacteroidetes bacterium GWF2_38_335]OFY81826.1 MAG: hypothetical protein A2281_06325 [Bacteroidetes bacterium RIFOXYA12_FULL_38_20]HBS87899.1 hypothetical protein [Bacteroidales bacterium]